MRGPLSGMVTTRVGAVRRATATPRGAIVEPAVMTADQQGHGSVAVGLQGGLSRQHVGRQAVVDELDPTDVTDGVAAAGQAGETLGGGGHQRLVARLVHAHGHQYGAGDGALRALCSPGRPSTSTHGPPKRVSRASTHCTGAQGRGLLPQAGLEPSAMAVRTPGLVHKDSLSA